MKYVGFMKNFLLADSSELLAVRVRVMVRVRVRVGVRVGVRVRVILASSAQERLIPTF